MCKILKIVLIMAFHHNSLRGQDSPQLNMAFTVGSHQLSKAIVGSTNLIYKYGQANLYCDPKVGRYCARNTKLNEHIRIKFDEAKFPTCQMISILRKLIFSLKYIMHIISSQI